MSQVFDVYIHGYSGNAESLKYFANDFSSGGFEILTLPGFHDDTVLTEVQKKDIFAYSELVWQSITKLASTKKVRRIAHSHGCMLAFAIATSHPERIESCVFIAPVARPAFVTGIFTIFLHYTAKLINADNTVSILRNKFFVDAISNYQVSNKKDKSMLKKISAMRRREAQMYRTAVVDCLMHSENFAKNAADRILATPVLLVLPGHDKIAGKADILWYKNHISQVSEVSVDGGHISIVEQPLVVSDTIKNTKTSILS